MLQNMEHKVNNLDNCDIVLELKLPSKYLSAYVTLIERPREAGETQHRDAEDGGETAGREDGESEGGG